MWEWLMESEKLMLLHIRWENCHLAAQIEMVHYNETPWGRDFFKKKRRRKEMTEQK